MNEVAIQFLQTYAAGGEPEGGWMFGKALQQARLDYSPESLLRLDALLIQIRERAQPTREQLDSPQGRNFGALLAFYVMEIVHRLSRVDLVWHDPASALRAMPPGAGVQDGPGARLVAVATDQQMAFQPLVWLEAQLLPEGELLKGGEYVAANVARLERGGRPEWWEVAHAAGRIASWQMQAAANGRQILASMVGQGAPRKLTVMGNNSKRPEGQQKAIACGVQLLQTNPDGMAWQVLAFNGFNAEAGARQDAIIVFASTYGEMGARLVMAFPYRQAYDGSGFSIMRPWLRESNLAVEMIGKLNIALQRGIRDAEWSSGGSWAQFYRG
jgi:hypothetical protein